MKTPTSTPIEQLIAELRYSVERHGDDLSSDDAVRLFKWLDANAGPAWRQVSKTGRGL